MKIETKLLHAGIEPDTATGAIMTPVYQTSTFVQDKVGVHKGYAYARSQNPTRKVLENNLAAIENARFGLCFGSGMAAIDAVLKLLTPGDEVVSTSDLYGGAYRIFTTVFAKYGIKFSFVDMTDVHQVKESITSKTKLIWVETPTNPMMSIIDIKAISLIKGNALLAVDNTFATPFLQNPINLGADIVMHSVTKFLGGHSDVVMGGLIVDDESLANQLYKIQNSCGAVPGPQDCFLVLRGIKTLHLRMERHSDNAKAIADFLQNHPKVDKVYWPGLPSHNNYQIALKQMKGFGGMVSFSLKEDTMEAAHAVLNKTHLFSLAESLGGVESLIGHPATMTHASIPREIRIKSGVVDSLIRLSVGVEHIEDLMSDLATALK